MSSKTITESLPIDISEGTIFVINQPNPNSYTHGFFKYPCKFIPEIPRWALRKYLGEKPESKTVLDPFAGSGTTLLEASINGIESVGTEIDEIAKLLIKVKTTVLSNEDIAEIEFFCEKIIDELNNKLYDNNCIILPEINNLEHWFNEENLNDLGYLYYQITELSNENIRDFLKICMASIIKKVSNADDISPKPYVSKKVIKTPPSVAKTFTEVVKRYLGGMKKLMECNLARVRVEGDALHIPCEDGSIDLAITSPPDINAFDSVRTLRLENLWLNLDTENGLREKKKQYVGTESINVPNEEKNIDIISDSKLLSDYYSIISKVDKKRALIMKKFFEEMKTNLTEVYRSLKASGVYVIVVGNSSIRNTIVETWRVLQEIAEQIGYKYELHFSYEILNPYIRIPRGEKGGIIGVDHILVLRK